MKIAFITDSDKLGESGVGDYALLLSGALRRHGVDTDFFTIAELRGSNSDASISRILDIAPDWLSYQFVPYAYARRGLVNRYTLPWERLRGRLGTHVMFHETWIGAHQGASWKDRIVGALQKRGISSMVRQLQPDMMHCSNELYSEMLSTAGIPNRILPLFGAIPLRPPKVDPYVKLIETLHPEKPREGWTVAVLFGSIYPSLEAAELIRWLEGVAIRHDRCLLVASVGHCPGAESHFANWRRQLGDSQNVIFHAQGSMPAEQISQWLWHADCGISTTPYNIIGKSSSAAALSEHGLPVLVCDEGAAVRGLKTSDMDLTPRFWRAQGAELKKLLDLPPKMPPRNAVDEVAETFLRHLEKSRSS